jgi:chorismate synthase
LVDVKITSGSFGFKTSACPLALLMQNTAKKRRVTAKIRFIVKVYKVRGNQQEY